MPSNSIVLVSRSQLLNSFLSVDPSGAVPLELQLPLLPPLLLHEAVKVLHHLQELLLGVLDLDQLRHRLRLRIVRALFVLNRGLQPNEKVVLSR